MEDRVEKRIEIAAPRARVWQALTDSREFGEWFKVKLDGPFVVGETVGGYITHPGYEHLRMEVTVTAIEPMTRFAYTWHPYAVDPKVDYSGETQTLVEFRLGVTTTGTLLMVTESGFAQLPPGRYAEAFRMNSGGWEQQMKQVEAYVRAQA